MKIPSSVRELHGGEEAASAGEVVNPNAISVAGRSNHARRHNAGNGASFGSQPQLSRARSGEQFALPGKPVNHAQGLLALVLDGRQRCRRSIEQHNFGFFRKVGRKWALE